MERCLSFTVGGPWGHFRRIEGNIVKQTYQIIPRTTVAGLVAAMLGIDRDGYYQLFGEDESLVAIEPVAELRTINLPVNALSTADGDIRTVPRGSRKLRVGLPDPTKPRQQHNYEVLVEPAYRIDLWLSDQETFEELRERLDAGESYYAPSLGLSEYLATVEYHGEFPIEEGPEEDVTAVDSVVPEAIDDVVLDGGQRYRTERSPAFMERDEGGRTTTGFCSYAFSPDGESLLVDDVETARVDDRTVMFT